MRGMLLEIKLKTLKNNKHFSLLNVLHGILQVLGILRIQFDNLINQNIYIFELIHKRERSVPVCRCVIFHFQIYWFHYICNVCMLFF